MEQFLDFAVRNWVLFVALFAILGMLIAGELMRKLRGGLATSPTEALRLHNDDDALLLDIRDAGEFREGHIPGARNIPLANLKQRLGELERYKSRPIIVYCRSGARATAGCGILKGAGFGTLRQLTGGIQAWINGNLPVVKGK